MNWFLDLNTRNKLFVGLGLVVVVQLFVMAGGYNGVTSVQASLKALYENQFQTAVDLKDVRSNQNAVRANLLSALVVSDESEWDTYEEQIRARDLENDEKIAALLDRNRDNPEVYRALEEFQAVRQTFARVRETELFSLMRQGRIEEATALALGEQAERNRRLAEIADELVRRSDQGAASAVSASAALVDGTVRTLLIGTIIIVFLSVVIALVLASVIGDPLRRISNIAERVGTGDLTVDIPEDGRRDEIGRLTATFRKMVENLRQVTVEITEGANVLASAAGEIVATTSQVASGAAETATAVTETTSTVEEVKKTAELASEKARYVSETAQKTEQVSQSGREAVQRAVEGINGVRQQMEELAQTIVQLSEQGQAIGEIIATVNDLSEQSNLLAVNAAIEAAKAGEQGKGFGVVAQEIKSLAEQSKQATGQVRGILGDIQKATSAAVLAAERGSKAVEAGAKQSAEADEAIRALAQSITEAAQAATQIAASSREQQVGMDQVGTAMENIKQASAQNVTGTRQAETAAHNLSELGQKLKGIIEQYKT